MLLKRVGKVAATKLPRQALPAAYVAHGLSSTIILSMRLQRSLRAQFSGNNISGEERRFRQLPHPQPSHFYLLVLIG